MDSLFALLISTLVPVSFSTDLCTGFPEGTRREPNLWAHCCVEHDLHYWAGGTRRMRRIADIQLRVCVKRTGAVSQAKLMYAGVRAGHLSPVKFPQYQWGNAWKMNGDFRPLTHEEVSAIEADLPHYEVLTPEISERLVDTLKRSLEPTSEDEIELLCPEGRE